MADQELIKDITGYLNTALRIILFLPQLYHVFSKRDASGLSTTFMCIGILLSIDTFIYGYFLEELPLIIASVTAFISIVAMLSAKCLWTHQGKVKNEAEIALGPIELQV